MEHAVFPPEIFNILVVLAPAIGFTSVAHLQMLMSNKPAIIAAMPVVIRDDDADVSLHRLLSSYDVCVILRECTFSYYWQKHSTRGILSRTYYGGRLHTKAKYQSNYNYKLGEVAKFRLISVTATIVGVIAGRDTSTVVKFHCTEGAWHVSFKVRNLTIAHDVALEFYDYATDHIDSIFTSATIGFYRGYPHTHLQPDPSLIEYNLKYTQFIDTPQFRAIMAKFM